jgi:hypothetical protein
MIQRKSILAVSFLGLFGLLITDICMAEKIINTQTGEVVHAESIGHHQMDMSLNALTQRLNDAGITGEEKDLRLQLFKKYASKALEDGQVSMQEIMQISSWPKTIFEMDLNSVRSALK